MFLSIRRGDEAFSGGGGSGVTLMFGALKRPRDPTRYPRSAGSRPLTPSEGPGSYVFVVDASEVIHVAPDGYHMHPKVLGNAEPALYADEITLDRAGHVAEVTNLSGTFRFHSRRSLCRVAEQLQRLGFTFGRVVWYPPDGSSPPVVLNC
jgi:hypothetical protein